MSLKLNLGCSTTMIEGYVGVDLWTPPWANDQNFQRADLRHSWPWADNSVDHIRAYDIIEHLPDKIHTMNEIHRVLKSGASVEICVPTTDGPGAWQDPTHVSYWNRNSFLYVTAGDPHYHRFKDAYGIKGAFVIDEERLEGPDPWGVAKLTIKLLKVIDQENKDASILSWPIKTASAPILETDIDTDLELVLGEEPEVSTPFPAMADGGFLFSILHTSARPHQWKKVYDEWIKTAAWSPLIEYILVIDPAWGFIEPEYYKAQMRPQDKVIVARKTGYVSCVNQAAEVSSGLILVVNADDQYPCDRWDEQLSTMSTAGISTPLDEFVIEVNTGTPQEHERGILVIPILSRARYRKVGYVLYPEYVSMYADNDFCAKAGMDDCVIDCRHIPVFPHKHPLFDKSVQMDAAYQKQNDPDNYRKGMEVFQRRQQTGFKDYTLRVPSLEGESAKVTQMPVPVRRQIVACCLPGAVFSSVYMSHWTSLFGHMQNKYQVGATFGYSSSVYVSRATMAHHLITEENKAAPGVKFDYVLWIDDDNVLTPEQFEMLKEDLDMHPELDVVVAWCWVQTDWYAIEGSVSCGIVNESGMTRNLTHEELMAGDNPLVPIDWSGFPVVLMRGLKALRAAGKHPFQALTEDQYSWGMAGEDVSFFLRAKRAGCKFSVDRRIEVPHFKSRPVGQEKNAFKGVTVIHKTEPKGQDHEERETPV